MSRKGQSITLSLSTRDKTELEAIALELGILWGERANISKLVEAIARRQLLVLPNQDWTDSRIQALDRTIGALTDIGRDGTSADCGRIITRTQRTLDSPTPQN